MLSWLKKKPVKQLEQGREYEIGGKTWKFYNTLIPTHDGDTDNEERVIRLQQKVSEKRRLEITLHESLHAFCWQLSETSVTEFAEEMAVILIREGLTNQKCIPNDQEVNNG
jgi:hypothetical protein